MWQEISLLAFVTLLWLQVSGVIVAGVSTLLMCRDSVEFRYGKRSAALASIWSRGCARVIDCGIMLAVTGWVCFKRYEDLRPDWESIQDALWIQVYDDVSVSSLSQVFTSTLLALAVSFLLLTTMQGLLGYTPGKWVCGLRVTRTTLRRCHFARSLYRELLLFLESIWLLWWIPPHSQHGFHQSSATDWRSRRRYDRDPRPFTEVVLRGARRSGDFRTAPLS